MRWVPEGMCIGRRQSDRSERCGGAEIGRRRPRMILRKGTYKRLFDGLIEPQRLYDGLIEPL